MTSKATVCTRATSPTAAHGPQPVGPAPVGDLPYAVQTLFSHRWQGN